MGDGSIFIVVDAALCEDIRYLLPDAAFAGTDRADTLKQLTEVVVTKRSCSLFEAFVIQREALGHILLQDAGCPDAELCRAAGIDAVADGDNRIQIVKICFGCLCFSFNGAVGSGYFHFGKDHFFIQFTFGKDVFQMFADGRRLYAKQLGHALLRKPNCFVFNDGVYAHIFFGGLIHQKTKIVAHGSVLSVLF